MNFRTRSDLSFYRPIRGSNYWVAFRGRRFVLKDCACPRLNPLRPIRGEAEATVRILSIRTMVALKVRKNGMNPKRDRNQEDDIAT